MTNAEIARPISLTSKDILKEIISHLESSEERSSGLCVKGKIQMRRNSKWGPADFEKQFEESLDSSNSEINRHELLPMLKGNDFEHYELQSTDPEELIIRTVSKSSGEISQADFYIKKNPVSLVSVVMKLRTDSWIVNLILNLSEVKVLFGYVEGAPFPIKLHSRMRSRGIGPYRVDFETIYSAQYEPCG